MTAIIFKPLGVIATVMRWDKPAWWFFNLSLLAYQLVMLTFGKLIGKVDIRWRDIWRYAQYCHVRLLLEAGPNGVWKCLSITAPYAKYDFWTPGAIAQSKGHFVYLEPTFEVDTLMVERAIEGANKIVNSPQARRYDYFQILSYLINLPIWIFWWPSWGQQVIPWFNLPGAREVCSSGIAALIRQAVARAIEFFLIRKSKRAYATAMISPCLYAICKRWKR